MNPIDRRSFLRGAALSGAALASTAAAPVRGPGKGKDCEAPETDFSIPASTLPADPADCPVDHIGVLMMENRSFDTYLGWLPGSRGFLDLGLDLTYTDPASGETGSPRHWAPVPALRATPTRATPGARPTTSMNRGSWPATTTSTPSRTTWPRTSRSSPAWPASSRCFDRYFCSLLGPTYPNRHYQHGHVQRGEHKSNDFPFETDVPDRLRLADDLGPARGSRDLGAYYFSDLPFAPCTGHACSTGSGRSPSTTSTRRLGQLPHVFFVDPSSCRHTRPTTTPAAQTSTVRPGVRQQRAARLRHSTAWQKGMFFINYDEHGGFFDHVTPPRVPDERASSDFREDFGQLGFRVPALAISPYSRGAGSCTTARRSSTPRSCGSSSGATASNR
jgi:phospholipase C